jgi:hypothetical protein
MADSDEIIVTGYLYAVLSDLGPDLNVQMDLKRADNTLTIEVPGVPCMHSRYRLTITAEPTAQFSFGQEDRTSDD